MTFIFNFQQLTLTCRFTQVVSSVACFRHVHRLGHYAAGTSRSMFQTAAADPELHAPAEHQLRGPSGQDRAADGHRQREPRDGGAAHREQG